MTEHARYADDPAMPIGARPDPSLRGNARRVAEALRHSGPATRAEVAARTGLSRATVSAALSQLLDLGLVLETGESAPGGPGGGRRPGVIRLGPRAGLAVGVDVGRQHLRAVVADLGHEVLAEVAEPSAFGQPAGPGLDRAPEMVGRALAETGLGPVDVLGVGLGLPAPIDQLTGRVSAPTILPEWAAIHPGPELADRLGRPVLVDNDANLGALAEHLWGAGRGISTMAYVKAATGIGSGLILDGRLFRGAAGTSGELGHITLDEHGDVCRCGNRGCLDLVAGGNALVAMLRRTHPEVAGLAQLIALAREGDGACRRIVADAGTHVGVALGSLVNLVNPERVVIGGELGRAGEILLEPIRSALRRVAIPPAVAAVQVVAGELGDRSEVLGAVAVVLREPHRLTGRTP